MHFSRSLLGHSVRFPAHSTWPSRPALQVGRGSRASLPAHAASARLNCLLACFASKQAVEAGQPTLIVCLEVAVVCGCSQESPRRIDETNPCGSSDPWRWIELCRLPGANSSQFAFESCEPALLASWCCVAPSPRPAGTGVKSLCAAMLKMHRSWRVVHVEPV